MTQSKLSKYRSNKRSKGICLHCVKPARLGKAYCQSCADKINLRKKKRLLKLGLDGINQRQTIRQKNKSIIMNHYGPGCKECGETNLAFLTLDHINNDGANHRRNGQRGGSDLYSKLISGNFPDGYQCLCWNCNYKKEHLLKKSKLTTKKSQYAKIYNDKLISEVFNAYGGMKCTCCQNTDLIVLTIDHINGNGKKEKQLLNCLNSSKFYCWLRMNGFPSGYRPLCRNCNSGRYINGGICPHTF